MLKTLTIGGSLILVSSAGLAQQTLRAERMPSRAQHAGVYHVATGTWTHGQDTLTPSSIYYSNLANTGFFGVWGAPVDMIWTDEGCMPTSGHAGGASDDGILVQSIEIGYCSLEIGSTQTVGLTFYDSYASCTDPTGLPVAGSFLGALPGGLTSGACWIVTLDLVGSGTTFKMTPDADGVFDGTTVLDNFGWTLFMDDVAAGGFNGPLLNGDPNNYAYGDGTYYQNPGASLSTGLDTRDQFWSNDPSGSFGNGCYWFGGYTAGAPFASFWIRIGAKPNNPTCSTKYCVANPNSTGAPADIVVKNCGSANDRNNPYVLSSSPVPNQPGIFFYANNQAQIPFGNGFLCATGGLVRGGVVTGVANRAEWVYDWNLGPKHDLRGVAGQTKNFQYWYRDPMGGGAAYNTSNAVAVHIDP
jgi:hypothetical protein